MRPYLSILAARFRVLLQYRAAALAGLATQIFWGFIRVMVFTGFYAATDVPQPLSLPEVISYIWLSQGLLLLMPWRADPDIGGGIRNGNVVYELTRPVGLYGLWYSRHVAMRTAPALLRSVPIFMLALPFFGLQPPPSVAAAAAFVCSLLGAVLLSAAITNLLAISLFWTLSGEGLTRMLPQIANLFSGLIVPLPLFPSFLQPLVLMLPFRGLMDTPLRLYLGDIPPAQLPAALAHQLIWTLLLVAVGKLMLQRAMRRVVVQGG
jgi:ABC-2 type transport system permease protein